jgi:pimeloyl-ACP methyl ester carboxylesterase
MDRVQAKGLTIAYQLAGDGPPVVLLHGFSLDSRSWRPQIEALSATFTVLAWDAPGAGESEDPPAGYTIGDWAAALAGVLDATAIQHAHIVGISWGGLLAQEFYHRYATRVISIVLAGTYAGWSGSLSQSVADQRLRAAMADASLPSREFVAKYLPGMFGDVPAREVESGLGRIMADFHPAGFRLMATALARADTTTLLTTIAVPTLLVWGDADKRSPLTVGRTMRDAIPRSRLEVIRGAGHLCNLERPAEFNAIVRAFFDSLAATD